MNRRKKESLVSSINKKILTACSVSMLLGGFTPALVLADEIPDDNPILEQEQTPETGEEEETTPEPEPETEGEEETTPEPETGEEETTPETEGEEETTPTPEPEEEDEEEEETPKAGVEVSLRIAVMDVELGHEADVQFETVHFDEGDESIKTVKLDMTELGGYYVPQQEIQVRASDKGSASSTSVEVKAIPKHMDHKVNATKYDVYAVTREGITEYEIKVTKNLDLNKNYAPDLYFHESLALKDFKQYNPRATKDKNVIYSLMDCVPIDETQEEVREFNVAYVDDMTMINITDDLRYTTIAAEPIILELDGYKYLEYELIKGTDNRFLVYYESLDAETEEEMVKARVKVNIIDYVTKKKVKEEYINVEYEKDAPRLSVNIPDIKDYAVVGNSASVSTDSFVGGIAEIDKEAIPRHIADRETGTLFLINETSKELGVETTVEEVKDLPIGEIFNIKPILNTKVIYQGKLNQEDIVTADSNVAIHTMSYVDSSLVSEKPSLHHVKYTLAGSDTPLAPTVEYYSKSEKPYFEAIEGYYVSSDTKEEVEGVVYHNVIYSPEGEGGEHLESYELVVKYTDQNGKEIEREFKETGKVGKEGKVVKFPIKTIKGYKPSEEYSGEYTVTPGSVETLMIIYDKVSEIEKNQAGLSIKQVDLITGEVIKTVDKVYNVDELDSFDVDLELEELKGYKLITGDTKVTLKEGGIVEATVDYTLVANKTRNGVILEIHRNTTNTKDYEHRVNHNYDLTKKHTVKFLMTPDKLAVGKPIEVDFANHKGLNVIVEYEYIDVADYKGTEKVKKTYINVVDEDDKEVVAPSLFHFLEGQSFQYPEVEGYTFSKAKAETGKHNGEDLLTLVYEKKKAVEDGLILIEYVDEDGTLLDADEKKDLPIGKHKVYYKEIKGYTVKGDTSKEVELTETDRTARVYFEYTKDPKEEKPNTGGSGSSGGGGGSSWKEDKDEYGRVTVYYEDEDGKELKSKKVYKDLRIDKEHKFDAPEIKGYKVKGKDRVYVELTKRYDDEKVTFVYKKDGKEDEEKKDTNYVTTVPQGWENVQGDNLVTPTGNIVGTATNGYHENLNLFSDDVQYQWYSGDLSQAVELGIIDGVMDSGNTSFLPNTPMSYAQYFKMIGEIFADTNKGDAHIKSLDKIDTSKGDLWYSSYYDALREGGHIDKMDASQLSAGITRESAVTILTSVLRDSGKKITTTNLSNFADVSTGKEVVDILVGKDNNRFDPYSGLKRSEAMTMLVRVLNQYK